MSERSKSVRIKPQQADVCGGASPNIDMLPDEQAHTCTMIAIDASDQAKTRIPRALSDHRHHWHVSWDKVMREQSRQVEASP
jgi:hypothetical protein